MPSGAADAEQIDALGRHDRASHVAVERNRMRAPSDALLRPAPHGGAGQDDSDALSRSPLALATRRTFSAGGAVISTTSAEGAGHDPLHFEHSRRVLHRAPFRDGENGYRVAHAFGGEGRSVDGIDRDVD